MKLSRATGMLSKIRHYVSYNTLISIYYAIFSSHMTYGCQICGQKGNVNRNKISTLLNRMLKRIHFKPNDETVNPLYHKSNILKFSHYVIFKKTFCLLMTIHTIHFRYHSKIFLSLLQIFMNIIEEMSLKNIYHFL